jgi:hypothetical protein
VGDTKGVILNPNHKAIYHTDNQLFTTGLVDAPGLVDTTYSRAASVGFVYDDAPVARVVEELEAAYGIAITLENEQVSNCPITADVRTNRFTRNWISSARLYKLRIRCVAPPSSSAAKVASSVL